MTDPVGRGAHPDRVPAVDDESDPYVFWDAAYVLGSLSSTERREYENHLSGCQACRAAVGELGGMHALLALLSRDEIAKIDEGGLEPPPMRPQLLDELMRRVSRRRRRARLTIWVAAAAAAAVAVALLVVIRPGPIGSRPAESASSASSLSMTPMTPSDLAATVSLTSRGWGTQVDMTCVYHEGANESDPAGDELALVAVGRDGVHTQVATWRAFDGVSVSASGSVSLPINEIAAVQVVATDTRRVLLQRDL